MSDFVKKKFNVPLTSIKGDWGKLVIFNIYLEGDNNATVTQLKCFHRTHTDIFGNSEAGAPHVIWVGNFNHHHPHWDNPNDTRLFTPKVLKSAEGLIEVVSFLGLELALPSGIPTHQHNVIKKWTCLDQVFITDFSTNLIETCDTEMGWHGIKTDHLLVIMWLNLEIPKTVYAPTHNFCEVDWKEFCTMLSKHLTCLTTPGRILTQDHLNVSCSSLIEAIKTSIDECVLKVKICSRSKCW